MCRHRSDFRDAPEAIAGDSSRRNRDDPEAAIDAIFAFTTAVLRVVAPMVPCVKFQSAYFERYLWEGVEAYYSLIAEASELGLLVIGTSNAATLAAPPRPTRRPTWPTSASKSSRT